MRKRIIFCIGLIFFAFLCTTAFALEGQSGPYSYEVKKNGDLKITKFDWDAYGKEDVYIPKMIDGYTVTEIGEGAFSSVKMINGYTITEIGEKDFLSVNDVDLGSIFDSTSMPDVFYLSSISIPSGHRVAVIIPNTVTTIGEKAFFATEITTVHIPESVTIIGTAAFADCRNLSQFSVDNSNPRYAQIDGVLFNKQDKELITYPIGKKGGYDIPEGIISVAPYAFYSANVGRLTIPNTVVSLGDWAFGLAKVYTGDDGRRNGIKLSSSIQSVGEYCFSYCNRFASGSTDIGFIDLSEMSLTEIPKGAFAIGQGLAYILLPEGLEKIGESAFESTTINSDYGCDIDIPSTIQTIEDNAFYNRDLAEFVLPNGAKKIGARAFFYEKQSHERIIELPSSITDIGESFANRDKVRIKANEGSFAYLWAIDNGYTIIQENDTSWLN